MKYLITGVSGFVGQHMLAYLSQLDAEVYGIARHAFYSKVLKKSFVSDLSSEARLVELLEMVKPDYLVHLASSSSVGYSWEQPAECFSNNTSIFLNIAQALKKTGSECRLLSIGSSEQYGNLAQEELPVSENQILKPNSPYAVARVSQEQLGQVYCSGYDLDIVMTRSFNHIGPLQDNRFVVPSLIGKLVDIRTGFADTNEITTGNLAIRRDFLDVRDVVRAYDLILKKASSGEVFNVCSGTGTAINDVLELSAKILGVKFIRKTDPALVRPADIDVIYGSYDKLNKLTGWKPSITLENSLQDIIQNILDSGARAVG